MVDRHQPVEVAGLPGPSVAVAAGDRYTCALSPAGAVTCWGYNEFGQLGIGTTTDTAVPTAVIGLASGATAISARGEHTCALMDAGVMRCWGANVNGQLGDGTHVNSDVPVEVTGISGKALAIALGGEHSCAITSGGAVACWGWNKTGQLGDGTTVDRGSPALVEGLGRGVRAIAAGGRHTCALLEAGGVRCWGYNQVGQLGDGTQTDSSTPVDVVGIPTGTTAIALGGNFTCALGSTRGAVCWGLNSAGQLGNGAMTDSASAVEVSGLSSGIGEIACGYNHTCVVAADGGVRCWGLNDAGQLGDASTTDHATPVAVTTAGGTPVVVPTQRGPDGPPAVFLAIIGAAAALLVAALLVGARFLQRRRRAGAS
jgi:alpha-tubulin suppressor-like RCC1 family protein